MLYVMEKRKNMYIDSRNFIKLILDRNGESTLSSGSGFEISDIFVLLRLRHKTFCIIFRSRTVFLNIPITVLDISG